MHALAVSVPSAVFQGLTTFEAAGIRDFKPELWYGLMAPAGTPKEIVERVRAAVDKVLQDRSLRADLLAKGVAPLSLEPAEFAQKIRADIKLWGGIARSVNAKAD